MNTPYENLANAIILSAVADYREVLRRWVQHPQKQAYISEKQSLEHFFRSDWFSVLTAIDPEMLI
ncbi:MAG: hypothetical protein RR759_06965, partial [Ruthenibacterium sp.]